MLKTLASFPHLPRDARLYILSWGPLAFGYFGILGVLFNLYLLRLGYGAQTIGLLVGGGQLMWGLSAIPAGMIGNRIGNRNSLIWGIIILGSTTLVLLFAEFLPVSLQSIWIAIWWIASWIGGSLIVVNGSPYLMAVCEPEQRREAFTITQVVQGIGGFLGSLVAGLLPSILASWSGVGMDAPTAYWYALWLAPLFYLAATLFMIRTAPQPVVVKAKENSQGAKIPLFLILFVGLVVFLQTTGEGTVRAFFNVYLDTTTDVPVAYIGVVMGLGQFLPILSSLAAPLLMERLGTARTVIVAGITCAGFSLMLALFTNWFIASVAYIGILLGVAIAAISRSLFSQEIVEAQWRTTMAVAFTIGIAFGWASAASLGGYIIAASGYRTLFLLGALSAAASGLLLWGYLRIGARSKAAGPQPSPSS